MKEILRRVNVNPKSCLIIGDRLETDIAMGNKFGMDTALVMTGVKKILIYHTDLNLLTIYPQ